MNIFVSNLNYKVKDEDLRSIFEEFGAVNSAKVITDKYTRKSKGFGFVEMPNDDEAKQAIDKLNGSEFEGKNINVAVARPRTERPNNFGGGGGGNRNNRREGGGDRYNSRY